MLKIITIIDNAEALQREFQRVNKDNYSHEGYQAILDIFEGLDVELDVAGICNNFTECTFDELVDNYGYLTEDKTKLIAYLEYQARVNVLSNNNYLVQAF